MSAGKEKKAAYMEKFVALMESHPKLLIVQANNIGSTHLHSIRKTIRSKATLLLGKNTMMRKAIRLHGDDHPNWALLSPHIVGNIGLVFTHEDLGEVADLLTQLRVPAAAKAGVIAPQSVVIEKRQTNLEPTKTSFLQALNIASKINKGTIEILNDIHLITAGEKIGQSQAQLLQMLDIRPFTYGLEVLSVFDSGIIYDAAVLKLTDDCLLAKFGEGIAAVASLSLATGTATLAAFPHVVLNGFKNLLSVAVSTEYSFEQADKIKEMLANPSAFAAAAPAAAAAAPAAVVEEPKKEEKPESEDMGFDLFG